MPKLTAVASVVVLLASLGTLASACGGNSFSSSHSSGASDAGGTDNIGGSSNSAGSSSVAGRTSRGGDESGGFATGGSTSSGASGDSFGGGALGGTPNGDCSGPAIKPSPSACAAVINVWTHDAERGICVPMTYGGCGGTRNLYKSLAECQDACSDSPPSYDSCTVSTDCALGSPGCCGACDSPNVTAHDFISYNRKYAANVNTCGDVACGACPNPEGESTLKYFFPNCVAGRCIVEDLRTSSVTACENQSDCKVRPGRGCCPGCGAGDEDMFAVRNDGSFEDLVCGGEAQPCPQCVPTVTGKAICGAADHCVMEYSAATPTD